MILATIVSSNAGWKVAHQLSSGVQILCYRNSLMNACDRRSQPIIVCRCLQSQNAIVLAAAQFFPSTKSAALPVRVFTCFWSILEPPFSGWTWLCKTLTEVENTSILSHPSNWWPHVLDVHLGVELDECPVVKSCCDMLCDFWYCNWYSLRLWSMTWLTTMEHGTFQVMGLWGRFF